MNTKRSQFIARILLTLIEDPLHLKIYINKSSNKPNNFIFLFIIRNYRGKKGIRGNIWNYLDIILRRTLTGYVFAFKSVQ